MSTNPFDVDVRSTGLFENLKNDIHTRSTDILSSLPQFFRLALIEKKEGWYSYVNRYDLLVPFKVGENFQIFNKLNTDVQYCSQLLPSNSVIFITEHAFKTALIVKIGTKNFSVQDFVLAIAYHGAFHFKPDQNKQSLKFLYEEFVQKYHQIAFNMALTIGEILIGSFEEVYKKFTGDDHAYSTVYGRQPKIVNNGQIIVDGSNNPAAYFQDSYMQLPVRSKVNCGIRLSFYIQLQEPSSEGYIFSYGNREKNVTAISCEVTKKMILVKTHNQKYPGLSKILKVVLTDSMFQKPFVLEVALYPRGDFIVALDGWLKDSCKLPGSFAIYDGKVMVGSDLNGENSGVFLESAMVIEKIDKLDRLESIFIAGNWQIQYVPALIMPANLIERVNHFKYIGY